MFSKKDSLEEKYSMKLTKQALRTKQMPPWTFSDLLMELTTIDRNEFKGGAFGARFF